MAGTAMGSSWPHTTASGDGWRSMAPVKRASLPPSLLDVADEAREQQVAVEVGDHLPLGGELVGVDDGWPG